MTHALSPFVESVLSAPWSLQRTRRALLDPSRPAWRDALIVLFDVAVDGEALRRWLPPALDCPPSPAATVFVADYPDTSFGVAYRECGVLLHGRFRGEDVVHCAWMVVDDDSAMILGRELLGFPKKMAAIELQVEGTTVSASVRRRGRELLRVSGQDLVPAPNRAAFPRPILNVRGLPGALPAALWRMDVPERCLGAREGDLAVAVAGTASDPLHELGIVPSLVAGHVVRADLGVPPARPASIPRGVRPVALVSPLWLLSRLPLRTL
jgi:acetoacetate decarboxylase